MSYLRLAAFRAMHHIAGRAGFGVASYRPPQRRTAFARARAVVADRGMLTSPLDGAQLMHAVSATAKLGGCLAEVGVFRGATARLIRESDRTRPLHLFDTFTGLPETSVGDRSFGYGAFQPGEFACSLTAVREYLSDLDGITYHQGRFPQDTGEIVSSLRFSFVHLDVDLYDSSRDSLRWFYTRLVRGGILLSHDFATCDGPRQAMTEFCADKPEPLIELPGDQAMIVKL